MTKTVLITGASQGLGRATSECFADQGWNVAATMRNAAAHTDQRDNVLITRLDVQDRASIEQAIASTLARFGSIDVLINNAGFGLYGVFESIPREKILEQFEVNVFGMMDVTRAVLPHMRKQQSGVIVNVSSGGGVFALPMVSAYNASKFALEGFSESLSYELLSQNIVVKIIEAGSMAGTGFSARAAGGIAQTSPSPDYAAFVAATAEVFSTMRRAGVANAEDVARAIFDAATDGTDRLRYVATSDIEPWLAARRECSESHYIDLMRGKFLRARAPRKSG
ncbi:MAG: SDR family oxidoreductase [Steroidobacteraceae bacterium]